jgi:hypothetical protein
MGDRRDVTAVVPNPEKVAIIRRMKISNEIRRGMFDRVREVLKQVNRAKEHFVQDSPLQQGPRRETGSKPGSPIRNETNEGICSPGKVSSGRSKYSIVRRDSGSPESLLWQLGDL